MGVYDLKDTDDRGQELPEWIRVVSREPRQDGYTDAELATAYGTAEMGPNGTEAYRLAYIKNEEAIAQATTLSLIENGVLDGGPDSSHTLVYIAEGGAATALGVKQAFDYYADAKLNVFKGGKSSEEEYEEGMPYLPREALADAKKTGTLIIADDQLFTGSHMKQALRDALAKFDGKIVVVVNHAFIPEITDDHVNPDWQSLGQFIDANQSMVDVEGKMEPKISIYTGVAHTDLTKTP